MLQLIKKYMSILLVFISFNTAIAQELVSYSISDGLAHNNATVFYEAGNGYLWIGTWDGLSRFDGQGFTSFKHNPGDTTTIFNNQVRHITEDSTGQIWMFTWYGLVKYLSKNNSFQRIYLRGKNNTTNGYSFRKLCFTQNNGG
jgi:ligand-binding sensor domain-containing protein